MIRLIIWLTGKNTDMILLLKKIFLFLTLIVFLSFSTYNGYTQSPQSQHMVQQCGDGLYFLFPVSTFMYIHLHQDRAGKEQFIQSFLLNVTSTLALKIAVNKERPNGKPWSFPSAHTSVSFQAAAFIQKRYGWKYGIFAYLAALFVGFSRIYAEKHFIEDVVAGAALGIGHSYLFAKKYIALEKHKISVNYSFYF
jgi:membrane-associated phospholipid phosphatase